jgi:hypothetical protein
MDILLICSPAVRHDRFQAQDECSVLPHVSSPLYMVIDANDFSFLEIINARWGTTAHIVFTFFGLATNVIVSSKTILFLSLDYAPTSSDAYPWRISNRNRLDRDEHCSGLFPDSPRCLSLRSGRGYASFFDRRLLAYNRLVRYSARFRIHCLCNFAHPWFTYQSLGIIEGCFNCDSSGG